MKLENWLRKQGLGQLHASGGGTRIASGEGERRKEDEDRGVGSDAAELEVVGGEGGRDCRCWWLFRGGSGESFELCLYYWPGKCDIFGQQVLGSKCQLLLQIFLLFFLHYTAV